MTEQRLIEAILPIVKEQYNLVGADETELAKAVDEATATLREYEAQQRETVQMLIASADASAEKLRNLRLSLEQARNGSYS